MLTMRRKDSRSHFRLKSGELIMCGQQLWKFDVKQIALKVRVQLSKEPKDGWKKIWIQYDRAFKNWRWEFSLAEIQEGLSYDMYELMGDVFSSMFNKTSGIRPVWVKMEDQST